MDDIQVAILDVRRVKTLMRQRGLTQKDLASAMGLPAETISTLLRWRHRPGVQVIERLAQVLGVSHRELIVQPSAIPLQDPSGVPVCARRLRFLIEQRGLTFRGFAHQIGMPIYQLHELLQHDTTVDARLLRRLTTGLKVTAEMLSEVEVVLQPWPRQPQAREADRSKPPPAPAAPDDEPDHGHPRRPRTG